MFDRHVRRVVVAGTGTGVGKTRVTRALARALRRSTATLALKPVESGGDADARSFHVENPIEISPHPAVTLSRPLSPHLAARLENRRIELPALVDWVRCAEALLTTCDNMLHYVVVETAGGVLSPLSEQATNLDLVKALEPALLVLVAPDSLGVLGSLRATLLALDSLGRPPELVVLSAAITDLSTGTNADELRALAIADPALVLGPGEEDASALADRVLSFGPPGPTRS